jgi:hypothetical protein
MFCFYSCFSFRFGFGSKSKNPAIDWQSRGFEIVLLKSEVRSHDACMTADARPNGHISIGLRVLQHWCKRGFHLLIPKPSGEETLFGAFVKCFPGGKKRASEGLSAGRVVLDWFTHERQTFAHGHVRLVRDESLHFRRSAAVGHGAVQEVRASDHDADDVAAI